MGVRVCSLKYDSAVHGAQSIAPGDYQIIHFPYGVQESTDDFNMHAEAQPDGKASKFGDDRSGLIWPSIKGWGHLYAYIILDGGAYTETRDRFVRDPLSLTTGWDSTATEDHKPTPGGQYTTKAWGIFVDPNTPLSVMVKHDAPHSVKLLLAEFKLAVSE